MLRLPYGVKDLFEAWLDEHFPDRKQKVLNRIRDLRGGTLTAPAFGERMRGTGRGLGGGRHHRRHVSRSPPAGRHPIRAS